MADWERAYEEDRRRLAMGQSIDTGGRRGFNEDDNPFAEGPKSSFPPADLSPAMFASDKSPPTVTKPAAITTADVTEKRNDAADVPEIYAQYADTAAVLCDNAVPRTREEREEAKYGTEEGEEGGGGTLQDMRFGLRCLPAGWNMHLVFGKKFGRRLFFAEAIKTTFKGFLSPKETHVGCFVTPNALYLGDVMSGALIMCLDIQRLFEIYNFSDAAVGLRTRDAVELHLQTQRHTVRLIEALCAIASHWHVDVRTVSADAGRERLFRKEMRLFDKSNATWAVVEDPRTGLRVLSVAEPYARPLAPVAAKILHWFGGVTQSAKDWKGARVRRRRSAWATATCFFVAREEGPGGDGRGIRHCVAAEYVTELLLGPGAELGIAAANGPPQPPFAVVFDSEEDRRALVEVLQECYAFRKEPQGGTIRTTRVESVEGRLGSDKAGEARPHLFLMRPRSELYDFLRKPTRKD